MAVRLTTPATLPSTSETHHQVAIASGSTMVFVAGQVSMDAEGNLVGTGDVAAQVEQCYVNVAAALAEAGATFDDVVKLTIYTTQMTPESLQAFGEGIGRACARLGMAQPMPPITGIGVTALAEPEHIVEVDAVAVID